MSAARSETDQPWPESGLALVDELKAHTGRVALIEKSRGTPALLARLASLVDSDCLSVGRMLAAHETPPSSQEIVDDLVGRPVLCDLDVLFAPAISIDPAAALRELARRASPVFAEWPGHMHAGRATYSLPGRNDRYERRLSDVVILRPVETTFPDECPFTIERWSA